MLTQTEADQFMAMEKCFLRPPAAIAIPPGADDTHTNSQVLMTEKSSYWTFGEGRSAFRS